MRSDLRRQSADSLRWVDVFLYLTSSTLVLVSVWSLGGRAEGAIELIGILAWIGAVLLIFTPNFAPNWARRETWVPWVAWILLLPILVVAPLNASSTVVIGFDGSVVLQSLTHVSFLPSALIYERCREYGILLSGLLLFVMVLWHCVRSTAQIRRLISFLAANAIIAAIVGSYFRLSRSELILGHFEPVHPSFFASFRYHNHWTAFALLSLGLCGALAFYWNRRARRDVDLQRRRPDLIWFAGLLVLSFSLPLTTARAGMLFLVLFWLGVAVWFVIRALRPSRSGRSGSRRRYLMWLMPGFAIGLVAFSLWGARQGLLGEWNQTLKQYEQYQEKGFAEIDFARTDAWGDGWRMVRDRPYFGWGFGSHRYLYQIYARDQYRYDNGVVEHIKEFAHNDWMQYLAELGFIGFALLLIPPIYLTCRFRRSIFGEPFALALLFPCGLVLLLATFEFPLSNPAVLVLFSIQGILGFKYAALTAAPASAAPSLK